MWCGLLKQNVHSLLRPIGTLRTPPEVAKNAEERLSGSAGVMRRSRYVVEMVDTGDERQGDAPRASRRRLYVLALVDEFVPVRACLFTLWFADNGITVAQLSLVFVLWAARRVGARGAERHARRPRSTVAGCSPRRSCSAASASRCGSSFRRSPGSSIGAMLWAIHEAAASGAWEALIHDELEAIDAEGDYGVVIARVGQFGNVGIAAAALVSTPLLGVGLDLEALGWITCAMHVFERRPRRCRLPDAGWVVARSARRRARRCHRRLRRAANPPRRAPRPGGVDPGRRRRRRSYGLAILDDYVPLLARGRGLDDTCDPAGVPLRLGRTADRRRDRRPARRRSRR